MVCSREYGSSHVRGARSLTCQDFQFSNSLPSTAITSYTVLYHPSQVCSRARYHLRGNQDSGVRQTVFRPTRNRVISVICCHVHAATAFRIPYSKAQYTRWCCQMVLPEAAYRMVLLDGADTESSRARCGTSNWATMRCSQRTTRWCWAGIPPRCRCCARWRWPRRSIRDPTPSRTRFRSENTLYSHS